MIVLQRFDFAIQLNPIDVVKATVKVTKKRIDPMGWCDMVAIAPLYVHS